MDRARAVLERVKNKKDANSQDNNQDANEQKEPENEVEEVDECEVAIDDQPQVNEAKKVDESKFKFKTYKLE